jgi:hypothetical protein
VNSLAGFDEELLVPHPAIISVKAKEQINKKYFMMSYSFQTAFDALQKPIKKG